MSSSKLGPGADQAEPSCSENVVEFSPTKVPTRQPCLFGESGSKEVEAEVTDLMFCHQRGFETLVDIRCLKYSWVFDPHHMLRVLVRSGRPYG